MNIRKLFKNIDDYKKDILTSSVKGNTLSWNTIIALVEESDLITDLNTLELKPSVVPLKYEVTFSKVLYPLNLYLVTCYPDSNEYLFHKIYYGALVSNNFTPDTVLPKDVEKYNLWLDCFHEIHQMLTFYEFAEENYLLKKKGKDGRPFYFSVIQALTGYR